MNTHGFAVKNGQLQIGEFAVSAIAKKYGTPLYLMDESRIRSQMRLYKKMFKDKEIKTESEGEGPNRRVIIKYINDQI